MFVPFEAGTRGSFTTETDTATILDFPHFSETARQNMAPYRGAYCMRIRPNGGTTAAYLQEDTLFDDLDNAVTRYLRWYFYLGKDFVMADGDKFAMVDGESTVNTTTEFAAGIIRTTGNINFWYAETKTSTAQTITLGTTTTALGKWFHAELAIALSSGGTGTIDGYIDDVVGTQVGSLTQSDIVDVRFGMVGPDAGTSGTILFDDLIYDDARIYANRERFPTSFTVTGSEHVFVGPGHVATAALLTNGASNIMRLWDTNTANVNDTQGFKLELDLNAQIGFTGPIYFRRGCYVQLSGTNPRGQVILVENPDRPGALGPIYYSERGMINYGLQT